MTVQEARQSEVVKDQVSQQGEAACTIQEVAQGHRKHAKWPKQNTDRDKERDLKDKGHNKCDRCGKIPHKKMEKCPALKSACNRCGKTGHWQRMCRSKVVSEITKSEEQASYFMGSVNSTNSQEDEWTVQLNIGCTPVVFKIDTGADVCVMSEDTFKMLKPDKKLLDAKAALSGPGGRLKCVGQFTANTEYKDNKYSFRVFVIEGESVNNLLSRSVAQAMGLVKRVLQVSNATGEFGLLKTQPVKIVLQENAQPYAVHTARRIPIPLLKPVKEELERMEANDIIQKVTEPTKWCAPMVPAPKKSGKRKMVETLEGLQGVSVYMDNIIIHGKDMTEHNERLQRVLERLESAGLKLNAEKCVLRQRKLHFLGQVIDADGVRPDPAKVSAINNLSPPENVQELKRVLGLVNYLGKYIPNLATVGQPLYELLKSNSVWTWGPAQMSAFQQIKEQLTMSPTLKYYDVNKPTAVSADASSYGIGAVLMQLHGQDWRAVAYCSRRLSDAETRCQRLLMRLMRFNPTAEYAPGKTLVIADTLSRSPCKDTQSDNDTHRDVECYVASVIEGIPATNQKIDSI
ncbi:hypothetical protein MHYP_G00149630 [Metynnis hypsauchen]